MRRVRPTEPEQDRSDSLALVRGEQFLFVIRVRTAFVGREKSSSNHSRLRAQCQCSNKSTAIDNSTSRCDRSRRDRVNHAGHECERGHFSCDMTSGFNSLCDDYIDIRLPCALRLRDRPDLMQNLCANGMYTLDVCRRIAPKKGNDRYALFQADRDLFLDRKMQNQIYAKRFIGELPDTLNFFRNNGGGASCACRIPKPPALLTAATNSGPVRSGPIGAAIIGCSMPSKLQRWVLSTGSGLLCDANIFRLGEELRLR